MVVICGPDGAGSLRDGQMYSGMYLRCAPMLLQARDSAGYEKLRHFALADVNRLGEPTDAEAVLLSCLLLPISDPAAAAPLQKLASVASHIDPRNPNWKPREDLTLALLACRLDDRAGMEAWLAQSNRTAGYAAYDAMSRVISSLDYCELNRITPAQSELVLCRDEIEGGYNDGKIVGKGRDYRGIWFEWWMDRILFKEAQERIKMAPRMNARANQTSSTRYHQGFPKSRTF
jgi:hypothetical protein